MDISVRVHYPIDIKGVINMDAKYYVAKAIAETFYCQADDIDEMNTDHYRYTITGRVVLYNKGTLEITTEYLDNDTGKIHSVYGELENRHCKSSADYGAVIGLYFQYFNQDYDCYFGEGA